LNEQINSTEALSRDLKRSETINSNLNTTLAGLTKKLEALNQTLPLLCGRIKDVSTYNSDAVKAFNDVHLEIQIFQTWDKHPFFG